MSRKREQRAARESRRSADASQRPRWFWTIWLGLAALLCVVCLFRPVRLQYRLWQARRALAARDERLAAERLETTARLAPRSGETQFLLARVRRHARQYERALRHLDQAAALGYDQETLRRERLLTLVQAGQVAPVAPEVTALLNDPGGDNLEIYETVTRRCIELFQLELASLLLDGWQADFPRDAQPYYYRGLIHAHQEQWREARVAFSESLRRAPRRDDVRLQLARALREQYCYREAIEHYARCGARAGDSEAQLGIGLCRYELGDLNEAREELKGVLAKSPNNYAARLALGRLELSVGRGAEAVQWLEPAARQRPYEFDARHNLAWALVLASRKDEAREHFRFAVKARVAVFRLQALMGRIRKDPNDAKLRCGIAEIYAEYGQPDIAADFLQSALQLDPHQTRARQLLTELQAQRKPAADGARAGDH